MKWDIRHEPKKGALSWSIYGQHDGRDVYEIGFASEKEAGDWAAAHAGDADDAPPLPAGDAVVQESAESFPASDPPGWINSKAE